MKHEEPSKGKGVASLVLGIIGLLLFLAPYFGIVFSIVGLVLGYKQKQGVGYAGKILGIIGIALNGVMLSIVLIMLMVAPSIFI